MSENNEIQEMESPDAELSSNCGPDLRIICGGHEYELYGRQKDSTETEKINFAMIKCGEVQIQVFDVFVWLPSRKSFQPFLFVVDDHNNLSALLLNGDKGDMICTGNNFFCVSHHFSYSNNDSRGRNGTVSVK
jgi:hypothetical protein